MTIEEYGDEVTPEWVERMVEVLEKASWRQDCSLESVFPMRTLSKLLKDCQRVLHKEPTVVDIEVPEDGRINIVGDTHGQFHDVLTLIASAGRPSEKNLYLFNGDFVDRGAWGVEVLTTLLSWKLCYPDSVFLTRGNHESSSCTQAYGFYKELSLKYPDSNWERLYQLCKGVFASLPLCAVIEDKVYVAHGGLFRDPSPGKGAKGHKAKRRKAGKGKLKLGSLGQLRSASKGGFDPDTTVASQLISTDVLWSDPQLCKGLALNENRGIGLLFGPDMTEEFLRENKLKMIIRSHEGPDARMYREDMKTLTGGYSVDHEGESGKLVTIFSAPDYPQFAEPDERTHNLAAYIVLRHPDVASPEFKQFSAKPRPHLSAFSAFYEEDEW